MTTQKPKSKLAIARDEFLSSPQGIRLLSTGILADPANARFLKNRIEAAWLAGVEWGRKNPE